MTAAMSLRPLALLVLLAAGTACQASEERRVFQYLNEQGFGKRARGDANTENYVGVGDSVTIKDSLHPELQLAPQNVDVDGTINLPDIGQMVVLGMTRKGLEAALTDAYAPLYERTSIRVDIGGAHKSYFVVGEVQGPGRKAFEGDLTIFEAILAASPRDETANLGRVKLIRGDPVDPLIITVNFHDFIDYGDTTYNVLVRENDILYVPPTLIGTVANFVKKLLYPITVIVQPLQSILFFLAIQNNPNYHIF